MLQSLDNPALAFIVIDPLIARSDYHFNVTLEDLKLIHTRQTENLLVYAIVCMSRKVQDVTVNLQGPLVINPNARIGHQFVLVDTEYTTREKRIQGVEIPEAEETAADDFDENPFKLMAAS